MHIALCPSILIIFIQEYGKRGREYFAAAAFFVHVVCDSLAQFQDKPLVDCPWRVHHEKAMMPPSFPYRFPNRAPFTPGSHSAIPAATVRTSS